MYFYIFSKDGSDSDLRKRNWTSTTNIAKEEMEEKTVTPSETTNFLLSRPASWTSTPDLGNLKDDTQAIPTFSITLPRRKPPPVDTGQKEKPAGTLNYFTQRKNVE